MTNKSNWNVISEEEFKTRIRDVFERVADSLSKTLGPYGSTTIIEKYGEMHITKDGWQVLKNIRFDNAIDNNILMMLTRISAQVVIKVGDGSTSSIIAANEIDMKNAKENGTDTAVIADSIRNLQKKKQEIKAAIKKATDENSVYCRAAKPYLDAQKTLRRMENYQNIDSLQLN